MTIDIFEAKHRFEELIDLLNDRKEQNILITKNGKPIVQIVPYLKKNSFRIGAAKKEMPGFDISLEEFDSIPIEDFGI